MGKMKSYPKIQVLLFEPQLTLRTVMRSMLRDAGFLDIRETDRLEDVTEAVGSQQVDIILGDTQVDTDAMCDIIRDIRHDIHGENPFPIAIGLAGSADQQHIAHVVNAGFDAVILKPLDLSLVRQRVEHFLRARKPFAVTSTYIGPDRRQKVREGAGSARMIEVPNPLQLLCEGRPRETVMSRIRAARAEIDEEKVLCDAKSIWWLADKIGDACLFDANPEKRDALIVQINRQVAAVEQRLPRTAYAPVLDICHALQEVAARLGRSEGRPSNETVTELLNATKAAKVAFERQIQSDLRPADVPEPVDA